MSLIPGCVYTDPEIATVGLSADEAKKADISVKTSKYVMSGNGKTMIEKGERGLMKLIFDEETEVLLGATFMCSHGFNRCDYGTYRDKSNCLAACCYHLPTPDI